MTASGYMKNSTRSRRFGRALQGEAKPEIRLDDALSAVAFDA